MSKQPVCCRVPAAFTASLLSIFCCLSTANSQTQNMTELPDNVEKVTEVEGITEYRLSNGVQALLVPDSSKPQFTINVTVLVGSRHEGYGETGMAHLLEHMLFKGTSKYDDIPELLKERGVLNLNGTTSMDRTNYFETLPASDDNLEFAIDMESDRLVNSLIRAEDLASEMTVVRSEFERGENSPRAILFQRIMSAAYEWHNYGKSTIGNRTDIMRVPIGNLREFYRKFYQADNIMVVLAGKFDQSKALRLLEEKFGSLKVPDRELPKTYTEEPPQDGERVVVLRRVGDTPFVGAAWHITSAGDPNYAACQVLGEILNTVPAGPLYQSLVEKELASQTSCSTIAGHDPGMLLAIAQLPADGDIDAAKKVLLQTVEQLDESVVDSTAVKRAVNRILKRRERQFANSESFALNLSEWRAYGDWRLYFLHRDRLEKVTAADVLRVAGQYLMESNRTVGIFEPTEEPLRAEVPVRPDLKQALANYKGRERIAEGEDFEPDPDNIESRTVRGELQSGLKYALLPRKTRGEVVYITGRLKYGDEENLKGLVPATQLLPSLLSRGTEELDFQAFKDALNNLGATLSFSGSTGTLNFNIQAKKETLAETIALLKQALRTPLLDEAQLKVVARQQTTQLSAMRSDPQGLAINRFQRELSPWPAEDVRYAPTIKESIDRINTTSIDDVRKLHSEFLGGQHGAVAVVGDFDPDLIVDSLNDVFSGWEASSNFRRIENPAPTSMVGKRVTINTPDKKNAVYIAGMLLPMNDSDIDYEPLLVGNYILGGGPLSSRLADRVRKQEGLCYTMVSQFNADDQDPRATFLMFAISNPDNSEKVVDTIDEELTRFSESGVIADELEKAKSSYLKTREGRRAKEQSLARILLSNLINGRTMEFQKESDQRIIQLDKQQVDEAVRRHLDKSRLVIITAGDFESTETSNKNESAEPEKAGVPR